MSSGNYRAGGNWGKKPVQFTLQDAERIAAVVQGAERARRDRRGSTLPRAAGGGRPLAMAEFVGSWMKGQTKIVTVVGQQAATAHCSNYIVDVLYSNATRKCFVTAETIDTENYQYTLVIPECIR